MRGGVLPYFLTRLHCLARPWQPCHFLPQYRWSRVHGRSSAGLLCGVSALWVDRLMVVPRQLVALGEYSPASPICPASHVRKHRSFGFSAPLSRWVFAMRSPCWVGSVSVLDRNEVSYYTFLVFSRSLRDGVTLLGRVFSQISIGTKTLRASSLGFDA